MIGKAASVRGVPGAETRDVAAATRDFDEVLVVVAGDRALLGAAAELGMTTAVVGRVTHTRVSRSTVLIAICAALPTRARR